MNDPLQEFPRSDSNAPPLSGEHAKIIVDTVKKAEEAEAARNESEWFTAGKRKLSPKKIEQVIRKKLDPLIKINSMIQRVINGERIIDLNEFGLDEEED